MTYQYYIADVFTKKAFSGAQIAVFPQADGLDKANMQILARELNLSETAFVFSSGNGKHQRRMRTFTPLAEIDFAGHPIIAVGQVLASIGELNLEHKHTALKLELNIGVIEVNITRHEGNTELISFSLESRPVVDRFVPDNDQIAEVVSVPASEIENKKYNPLLIYSDQSYLIVPVKSIPAIRAAKFNLHGWSRSMAALCMANEILLFSPRSELKHSNFHARLLGPDIGVHEDPPIASAMPAFSAYLCAHDHIKQGTYTFVIDRGSLGKRKSVLNIEMDNKHEESLTIRLGGPAVITSEGTILNPAA